MRAPGVFIALLAGIVGCGGSSGPPPDTSLALAPAYDLVVVTKIIPDGLSIDHIEAFELRLSDLQSAGGQVVGTLERPDRGLSYPIEGRFDSETGELRFDPFEGALTSTRTERIDGVGGRADDDSPRDGLANTITGFVRTSSTALFQTMGQFVGVARDEGLPALELSKLSTVEVELGKIVVRAEPGFAAGAMGVELLLYSPFEEQATFRLTQTLEDGSLRDLALSGLAGDILVLRALRATRLGPAIYQRVTK